jgi:hypothetical protein
MRTIGVIGRNDRGTGSGTSAVCETSGEEDRALGDSSRDSSDATDEMVGSLPPGMREGDQRKSLVNTIYRSVSWNPLKST